jgi:hypothetical protein
MGQAPIDQQQKRARSAWAMALTALGIAPVNFVVWIYSLSSRHSNLIGLFLFLAFAQLVCGIVAIVFGVRSQRVGATVTGVLAAVGAVAGGFLGLVGMALGAAGGAWGRPLRVRGRQLHPTLRNGADWTAGERPCATGLDPATRTALATLWWHDAQKEHASVPAFSRVSWLLAAAGAPADLLEWAHRAAIEEIEHTKACFALAAGYAGYSRTVEPMPDLLLGRFDPRVDPRVVLAVESLTDGCQLEDFNADVAAECANVCEEPVTRAVLERIAREERSHAEFSWAVLDWALAHHRDAVADAIEAALQSLERYPRPTAVAREYAELVRSANESLLRKHGRLPDARWASIWETRLVETTRRVRARMDAVARAA